MRLFPKNIISNFLLLVFIFYSMGTLSLVEDQYNLKEDCSMKKGCCCCEMNSGKSCNCSNHLTSFGVNINQPCNHPNFEGINAQIGFAIIIDIPAGQSIVSYTQYPVSNSESTYHVEQTRLLKPPKPNSFQSV
jgi:hypothetical protein